MSTFQKRLASAVKFRELEKRQEARQILLQLQTEFSDNPQVDDQCAWMSLSTRYSILF